MDQAALLAALEAAARLGDTKLDPAHVEALAQTLGLQPEKVPALIDRLEKAGKLAIGWGGMVEVLPEQGAGVGVVFNFQGASFGPGATIAGRDAYGAKIQITPERAFGALAAVIEHLQGMRPRLADEAADDAAETIEILKSRSAMEASLEARHKWVNAVGAGFSGLLAAAPQLKDAVELGQEALKALGWS